MTIVTHGSSPRFRLPQGSRNQGYLTVKLVQKRFDMIGEKARCFLQCKATLKWPFSSLQRLAILVAIGGRAVSLPETQSGW